MAVLKNKRGISKYEYEHSFDVAYKYVGESMNTVPNRMKRWINTPINKKLNNIYSTIMELRTNYLPKSERNESNLKLVNSAIDGILDLQLHFYTYWNIMDFEDKRKSYWCELFNKELALLRGLLYRNPLYVSDKSAEERKMLYYRNEDIKKAAFLSNMSKLHKYTHKKIAHARQVYAYRECDMISDFIDQAWYYSLEANKKIPKTKAEYEHRKKCISSSISCLKKMEVPMKSLFNLMGYSESILREWSTIFNDTLKSLFGIRKSDKDRFEKLQ